MKKIKNLLIGYARVSTADQKFNMQFEALKKAGCSRIFSDVASGAKADRPGLEEALKFLTKGDTLIVWKIDRLGRSISHLIEIIQNLHQKKIYFKSLSEPGMDTNTPTGKLMFNIFAALADFERELIRERTLAGILSAKKRGTKLGRKIVMTDSKIQKAKDCLDKGLSVEQTAVVIKVSRATLYKFLAHQKIKTPYLINVPEKKQKLSNKPKILSFISDSSKQY